MRVLMIVKLPNEPFNSYVRDGTAGARIEKILDALKPENVHFTELGGRRTALVVTELDDVAKIPTLAEPFFLAFDAEVEIHPLMTRKDLDRAGLVALGQKWG